MTDLPARSLPDRPDLRHLRDEPSAESASGELGTLSAAQLAIAREYGFPSWPRLKAFVETRALDLADRAADPRPLGLLVRPAHRAKCPARRRAGAGLVRHRRRLASPAMSLRCNVFSPPDATLSRRVQPLDWTPLLYACFSRLLRTERAAAIVEVARLLLGAGADPNASWVDHDHLQLPIYAAAGIANNAELTRLLLAAGADPNETLTDADAIGEALYHAVEFADTRVRAPAARSRRHAAHKVSYCLGRALNFDRSPMVELLLTFGARPTSGHLKQAISKHVRSR